MPGVVLLWDEGPLALQKKRNKTKRRREGRGGKKLKESKKKKKKKKNLSPDREERESLEDVKDGLAAGRRHYFHYECYCDVRASKTESNTRYN
jgi:hypothetical protein